MDNFGEFLKTYFCGQTVLPDRSILLGQKLVESATFWEIFKHCELMFGLLSQTSCTAHCVKILQKMSHFAFIYPSCLPS